MTARRTMRVGIIGAGVMAESMIAGLLANRAVTPELLAASHPRRERREALVERHGIIAVAANRDTLADVWGHRALWHFEQAGMTLQATRQARRIGDLRSAAGDPESARRYYAEAIDEARDIGAEHEQGLAALGLAQALLELGDVTSSRRLAGAAEALLDRAGAPVDEVAASRRLRGSEVVVGDEMEETE